MQIFTYRKRHYLLYAFLLVWYMDYTSNFKYIIDTGVQSTYVLQNRTGGYDLSFQQYYCFVFWKTNKNIDRILVDTVCQNTTGNIKKTTRIKYVIRG